MSLNTRAVPPNTFPLVLYLIHIFPDLLIYSNFFLLLFPYLKANMCPHVRLCVSSQLAGSLHRHGCLECFRVLCRNFIDEDCKTTRAAASLQLPFLLPWPHAETKRHLMLPVPGVAEPEVLIYESEIPLR